MLTDERIHELWNASTKFINGYGQPEIMEFARAVEAEASPASAPEKIKKVESGFRGLFLKEAQAYKQGWNDCRAAMLAAAPTPPAEER